MPNYAYVAVGLHCRTCDHIVEDRVAFQWGHCPAMQETTDGLYAVGDAIRWRHCADGSIRPWTYFIEGRYVEEVQVLGQHAPGGYIEEANIGDPAYRDLIVRDVSWLFYWETPASRRRCEQCDAPIEGAAVEIREGIIQRAWLYSPGELGEAPAGNTIVGPAQYILVSEDGRLQPMSDEWGNRPMDRITNC